jgi:hypothetical protein
MVVIRDSRSESDIITLIITDCSIPLDNRNSHVGENLKVGLRDANID